MLSERSDCARFAVSHEAETRKSWHGSLDVLLRNSEVRQIKVLYKSQQAKIRYGREGETESGAD